MFTCGEETGGMQLDNVLGAFEVNERCMEANRGIGYREEYI